MFSQSHQEIHILSGTVLCTAWISLLSSVCAAALHSRCHDIEERVRLQAVQTVHEVATQHMDLTPPQVGPGEAILLLCLCVCVYVHACVCLRFACSFISACVLVRCQ